MNKKYKHLKSNITVEGPNYYYPHGDVLAYREINGIWYYSASLIENNPSWEEIKEEPVIPPGIVSMKHEQGWPHDPIYESDVKNNGGESCATSGCKIHSIKDSNGTVWTVGSIIENINTDLHGVISEFSYVGKYWFVKIENGQNWHDLSYFRKSTPKPKSTEQRLDNIEKWLHSFSGTFKP